MTLKTLYYLLNLDSLFLCIPKDNVLIEDDAHHNLEGTITPIVVRVVDSRAHPNPKGITYEA